MAFCACYLSRPPNLNRSQQQDTSPLPSRLPHGRPSSRIRRLWFPGKTANGPFAAPSCHTHGGFPSALFAKRPPSATRSTLSDGFGYLNDTLNSSEPWIDCSQKNVTSTFQPVGEIHQAAPPRPASASGRAAVQVKDKGVHVPSQVGSFLARCLFPFSRGFPKNWANTPAARPSTSFVLHLI